MRARMRVECTPDEARRLLGWPDVIPLVELASALVDSGMMWVVDRRLEMLSTGGDDGADGRTAPATRTEDRDCPAGR